MARAAGLCAQGLSKHLPASAGLGLHLRHHLTPSIHAELPEHAKCAAGGPAFQLWTSLAPLREESGKDTMHLRSWVSSLVLQGALLSCTPRGRSLLQSEEEVYLHQVLLGATLADDGVQ